MLAKLRRFVFALVGFALTTTIYLSLTPEMSFIKTYIPSMVIGAV